VRHLSAFQHLHEDDSLRILAKAAKPQKEDDEFEKAVSRNKLRTAISKLDIQSVFELYIKVSGKAATEKNLEDMLKCQVTRCLDADYKGFSVFKAKEVAEFSSKMLQSVLGSSWDEKVCVVASNDCIFIINEKADKCRGHFSSSLANISEKISKEDLHKYKLVSKEPD
jgi:hypothetical protein